MTRVSNGVFSHSHNNIMTATLQSPSSIYSPDKCDTKLYISHLHYKSRIERVERAFFFSSKMHAARLFLNQIG